MKTAKRDLTNYQWRLVSNAIDKCSLPIFVKLVFAEICRWRSYTKPQDTHLASTVMDSIMMLFERIEKQVYYSYSIYSECDFIHNLPSFIVIGLSNTVENLFFMEFQISNLTKETLKRNYNNQYQ